MSVFSFKFEIEPKSCPRPRLSRGHSFMPKAYKDFKKVLQIMAKAQARKQGLTAPIDSPVKITLDFCFKVPKSWSKKKAELAHYHTSRPDLDNLTKSVLDAFNELIWVDDDLVAEIHARKFWVKNEPCIFASIEIL